MTLDTISPASGRRIIDPTIELVDREEIHRRQWHRLQQMLRWIWATNPFYRDYWRDAGVDLESINSMDDFVQRVPMIEKGDFLRDQQTAPPFGRRLEHALALGERLDVYTTSGTSGQGVEVHAQTNRELAALGEMYRIGFGWAGLNPGDGVLMTLPITMMAGGRVEMHGALSAGMTVYPTGAYNAHEKIDLIRRFRPRALYGSTSYFGHLAAIHDDPSDLGIDVLLTGMEGAGFSYLEGLQDAYGARVSDRFGATQVRGDWMFTCEKGIGTANRPGLLHNLDPFVLLEVIDPETGRQVADGEEGEIVVTSLFHWDTPVVRCRLRDRGVWHDETYCSCGRPLGGLEVCSIGRTDDVKKIKGVNIYPEAVDNLLFSFPEVEEYRVTVTSNDTKADVIRMQVMPKAPLNDGPGFIGELSTRLRDRIGISFAVELCDDLPRSEYKARRWADRRDHSLGRK
ncbi:AMP-binding protein [Rhodococcus pyridinivorans]|uniref:phenylacetate--CoA ligase family protein n=1 Tax=Rhodococcus pyridinivorans TaxID=103816 RepID=UPI001E58C64A|nr:AMP-binding protein [Rhodococcus pyridinivorans]MCD5422891.1 AMP-binding protein [Rhodococcus pyridinivorans]